LGLWLSLEFGFEFRFLASIIPNFWLCATLQA